MRKLCSFALPFAGAVFAAVYLLPDALLLPAAALCALAALAGVLCRGDWRMRLPLIALGLSAGLLWTAGYCQIFYTPAQWLDGREETVSATVADYPAETRFGSAVLVRLHPDHGPDVKTLVFASEKAYASLEPGDQILFSARLRLADTYHGEESDYNRARGIYLTANAIGKPNMTHPERIPLRYAPQVAARALQESARSCFGGEAGTLISALITGDKSQMSGGLTSALRRTGLAHTVAVSGMHVSILSGMIFTFLGRYRRRSAVAGLAVLFFFAALTGLSPSVLRAVLLQSALLLAPILGREYDGPTALSAALLALLLQNPFAAASVSLQLSFASVSGIFFLTGPIYDRLTQALPEKPKSRRDRLRRAAIRFCAASLSTTLGALLFTTPLTAVYFGSLSLISPLSNLIALWAVSLAFAGGLATAALGVFAPAAGAALGALTGLPARYLVWIAPVLSRFPFAAVPMSSPYLAAWLLLAYGLALLYLLWRGEEKRPLVPLSACTVCLCVAILCTASAGAGGVLTVSVLDVGQGQSILLNSDGRTALVDCGGTGSADPGDVAADAIQSLGVSRLDVLILTHCHTDHAGGVPELLERLEVDTLILPAVEDEDPLRQEVITLAREKGTEVMVISEDAKAAVGRAELRIYAPLGAGETNEEGLSILCSAGEFDMLMTGDMAAEIEKRLIRHGNLPEVDLLVAGHHGSAHSTSEALLQAISPEYAVISVGYNTYGHPAPETLERLWEAGCKIYRTDWMGTIRFIVYRNDA